MSSWEEHKQRRLKAKKEKKRFLIGIHIVQLLCVLTLTVGIFVLQSPPHQQQLQNLPSTIVANAKNRRNNNHNGKKTPQLELANTNTTAQATTKTTKLESLRQKNPLRKSSSKATPTTTATTGKSTMSKPIPVTQVQKQDLVVSDSSDDDNVLRGVDDVNNDEAWIDKNLARAYPPWPIEQKYSWCHLPTTTTTIITKPNNDDDDANSLPVVNDDNDDEIAGLLTFVKTASYQTVEPESLLPNSICGNITLNLAQRLGFQIQQEQQKQKHGAPSPASEKGSTTTASVISTPTCNVHIVDLKNNNGTTATSTVTAKTHISALSSFVWTIVHKPSQAGFWSTYYGDRDQSSEIIQNATTNDHEQVKANEKDILTALEKFKNIQYKQLMTLTDVASGHAGDDDEDDSNSSKHPSNLRRRLTSATTATPDRSSKPLSSFRHNAIAHNRHIVNRSRKGGHIAPSGDGKHPKQRPTSTGSTRLRTTYGSSRPKAASTTNGKSTDVGSAVHPPERTAGNSLKTSLESSPHVKEMKNLLSKYNFIAVADRLDESLVALKLLLHLDHIDILYLKQQSVKHNVQEMKHDDVNICRSLTVDEPLVPRYLLPKKNLLMQNPLIQDQIRPSLTQFESNIDVLLYEAASRSLDKTIRSLNGSSSTTESKTTNTDGSGSGRHSIEDIREKILHQRLQAQDGGTDGFFDVEYQEHMIWQTLVDEYCVPKSTKMIPCPADLTIATPASSNDVKGCFVNHLGCGDGCLSHIWQASDGNLTKAMEMFPSSSATSTS